VPQLKNFMEEVVFLVMKDIVKDINVCTCEKCSLDIAAIALNDLPPKYIVSEKGELYSRIDGLR
jgi:competence protein ComFB